MRYVLHARGYRYRVDYAPLKGFKRRADVVFTRPKIAIFVDGCFWHGCPTHATLPKSNAEYWLPKLARNIERDRDTDAVLAASGWTVLRFWEHDPPDVMVEAVIAEIGRHPRRN